MKKSYLKLVLVTIFLVIIGQMLFAQNQWEEIYQMPRGNSLNDVIALDENHIIAVGDNGEVMCTSDGGLYWNYENSNTTSKLNSCYGINNSVCAIGENGTIIHSIDYGNNWTAQTSNTSLSLNGVSFTNESYGWIVGNNGFIISTINGGDTWTEQQSNTTNNLNSVVFVDNQNGWCVGNDGIILYTSDGGINWIEQESNSIKDLTDLSFVNSNIGYICADRLVLKTIDGGQNWFSLNIPTYTWDLNSICFVDENIGWVNREGYMFYTIDGGLSWNYVGIYRDNINSVFFINSNSGWAVGGSDGSFITTTNNGGLDWQIQIDETRVPLNTIFFVNEDVGWSVGGNYYNVSGASPDIILYTSNGGLDWEKQVDIIGKGIYDIQFTNSNSGFALSSTGIYKTINSGENWDFNNISSSSHFMSLSFINGNVGYIAGTNNQLKKTTDGGNTWNNLYHNFGNTYFQSIHFVDENNGWASGYGLPSPFTSRIIHTSDGGNTWELQYDEIGGRTWLHFVDIMNGWAVSVDGKVLHTDDGGITWDEQISSTIESLRDVQFIDTNTGWAVGDNGVIIKSDNGGITWNQESNYSSENLYSIFALDSDNIWSTGNNGIVLKSDFSGSVEILDQYQTDINYGFWFEKDVIRWQEFMPTLNNLTSIEVNIHRVGSAGNIISEIRDMNDVLLGQIIIEEPNIPYNDWLSINFSENIILVPNTKYRIYVYSDEVSPSPNDRYFWRGSTNSTYNPECACSVQENGGWPDFDFAFKTYGYESVNIDEEFSVIKSNICLNQNYPNPFNLTTTISFSIPNNSNIELSIFNIKGQKIKSLIKDSFVSGNHSIVWNGNDDTGKSVSSGVYLYILKVDGTSHQIRKCILMK